MTQQINLAYYRKKDWKKLLRLVDDRESMHDTWEEWNTSYLKSKKQMILFGLTVKKVVIDLNELRNYCSSKNIKINGKARAEFVSEID